jgi:hypothetical protein
MIGVMSWLGYASMMLLFLGMFVAPKLSGMAMHWLTPLAVIPWPWLGLFLGLKPGGEFSFALGMVTCWIAVVLAAAVWVSVWGTEKGLGGLARWMRGRGRRRSVRGLGESRCTGKRCCGFCATVARLCSRS